MESISHKKATGKEFGSLFMLCFFWAERWLARCRCLGRCSTFHIIKHESSMAVPGDTVRKDSQVVVHSTHSARFRSARLCSIGFAAAHISYNIDGIVTSPNGALQQLQTSTETTNGFELSRSRHVLTGIPDSSCRTRCRASVTGSRKSVSASSVEALTPAVRS